MSDLKPLYILGAGGFGREAAWLVERINAKAAAWDFRGFVDDEESLWGTKTGGYQVAGGVGFLETLEEDFWLVAAVGNAKVRQKCIEKLNGIKRLHYATLIDPDVELSGRVKIGEGTIVCAGSIVTVDNEIGKHNIVNLCCTVGHDAVLEDFVTLYPNVNISGTVRVGRCSEIGVGTQIIQGITIGSGVVVGAGSGVFRDVEDNVTVLGNPARVMKRNIE